MFVYLKSVSAKKMKHKTKYEYEAPRLNMNTTKKFVYLKSGSAKKIKDKTKYEYEASRLNMNTKKSLCT